VSSHSPTPTKHEPRRGILDTIERLGNALPEPAILFALLTALVIIASGIGSSVGWTVHPVTPKVQLTPKLDDAGQGVFDKSGKPIMVPKLDSAGKPIVELVKQTDASGKPVELTPRNLVTSEGLYWMLSSMVRNFTGLPALGLVFVSMLGIGLAEKFGLFSALMRCLAIATPKRMLTPMIVLIGANASVASDAGYVILPPLAAALYLAAGRSPIAGLAAAFSGVAGGFGGGFFPTAADGFLAGVATQAANILDPLYPQVNAMHNWYFKSSSAIVIMLAGWFVTDRLIEPRHRHDHLSSADTQAIGSMSLSPLEKRGLVVALLVGVAVLGTFMGLILVKNAPLNGVGTPRLANGHVPTSQPIVELRGDARASAKPEQVLHTEHDLVNENNVVDREGFVVTMAAKPSMLERPSDKWSQVIVPMILLTFLLPGIAYGLITGVLRSQADFIDALYHGIRSIVPVLAIAFFLGQFVNCFTYTGLDRMLAYWGGSLLVSADLPVPVLLTLFVLLVIAGDFAMSGMLSKFGVLAPIFIPMFMMVGMSPELTTAAYRIGDSVVNVITPLNSYLLIILAVMQKYRKGAGLGSLMALMLPYSFIYFVVWTGLLLAWYFSGADLGTKAPLHYMPPH
jgi:aminobenzoyl-glutamate transport protein